MKVDKIEHFYDWSREYWCELSTDTDNRRSHILNFGCWNDGIGNLYQAQLQLFDIFTKILNPIKSESNGLEVGCGIGGNSIRLCLQQPVNMTAMDISNAQLNIAFKHAQELGCGNCMQLVQGDSMLMPFNNEVFDFSICIESSFHYPRLDKYVSEQYRVLKFGARAIIADITCEDSTRVKFRQGNYFYKVDYMKSLLINEGFNVVAIHRLGPYVFEQLYTYVNRFNQRNKSKLAKYWSLVLANYALLYRDGIMGYDLFEIIKEPEIQKV